jgi:hypothetical protein
MSLAVAIDARFGNKRYASHVGALSVDLGLLPGVNHLRARLPRAVPVEAAPGDPADLTLDNGEEEALVLTGQTWAVARGLAQTEVTAVDAGAALAASRPATSYSALSAGDIIRAIAADVKARVGRDTLGAERLESYVAGQGRTGAEHVAMLAAYGGGIAFVHADGNVVALTRPQPPPSRALRYGRELLAYQVSDTTPGAFTVPIGAGAGPAGDPRALLPVTEALSGSAPEPEARVRWRAEAALRSPGAQRAAADAAEVAHGAAAQRLTATCWLLPSLRPGDLIEVQDLADGIGGGPWLVSHVQHRVGPTGATTRFDAVAGEGGALLAGLLGGLGGLL